MSDHGKPDNLVQLFESSVARYPDNLLFGMPDGQGNCQWLTYSQVGRRVDDCRGGLARLGIGQGDAVGIIANNCAEWAIAAFATYGLGGRFIPMYAKELAKIWVHIVNDGNIKVLLVADRDLFNQVQQLRSQMPGLEKLICIKGDGEDAMTGLEENGRRHPVAARQPATDDVALLIYTSGTTGSPKGVLLSHGNLTSNVMGGRRLFPELDQHGRSLSILPWAHSYGQTAELCTFLSIGASIGFARDVTTIAEDMTVVQPTFLIAVPRVFNKIYDGLWTKMNETGGLVRKLFVMGLNSAAELRRYPDGNGAPLGLRLKYKLADKIVFAAIRKRFGGRLTGALTASAMMNEKVARFFGDIGLPVFDCYGLTETSPAVTMNCATANRPGSVGRPIENVRVVIDRKGEDTDEGEIIVYGPNVMQGYHNRPDATAEVMTADGGFRTGDQGRLDEDGFLFITGRIKEQYKLENGKYVFPVQLEEEIRMVPWVENAMVYGEGRAYNICLIIPDFEVLKKWADENGVAGAPEKMVQDDRVEKLIRTAVLNHLTGKFGKYEIPRQFIIIPDAFSVENGMLTQTLKLKRRRVIAQYAPMIDGAYGR